LLSFELGKLVKQIKIGCALGLRLNKAEKACQGETIFSTCTTDCEKSSLTLAIGANFLKLFSLSPGLKYFEGPVQ